MRRFFTNNGGKIFLIIFIAFVCYAVGTMIYETFWGDNGVIPQDVRNTLNEIREENI